MDFDNLGRSGGAAGRETGGEHGVRSGVAARTALVMSHTLSPTPVC